MTCAWRLDVERVCGRVGWREGKDPSADMRFPGPCKQSGSDVSSGCHVWLSGSDAIKTPWRVEDSLCVE